ncbi:MAG: hypothetical protein IJP86_00955 [Synergistaceae bacterium]|nr:hypothetical protein [Synergistaceae bacterium]
MSLREKINILFDAAGSRNTTPAKMKSVIDGLKSEPEFVGTGALRTALQGALHIALMPGNDDDSERRLGVIRVIAGAVAEDCGRDYVRDVLETRGNPESIIGKILGE